VSKDHAAIQRAIDRCAEWGGGTAWVPPGKYLCGTLVLKSHVRLYLDAGATIAGSPDQEDYRRHARRHAVGHDLLNDAQPARRNPSCGAENCE